MASRTVETDSTKTRLSHYGIGAKADAATTTVGTTASIIAYIKGILNQLAAQSVVGSSVGEAFLDASEEDWTNEAGTAILNIDPGASPLSAMSIWLDWNKTTTGWDTKATAAQTIDTVCVGSADGTNFRTLKAGTQVTASGNGSLTITESGQLFEFGPVGEAIEVRILVSAEPLDCEIPYLITYVGTAPTITASVETP